MLGENGYMNTYGWVLLLSPEIIITLLISSTLSTRCTCVLSHFSHVWLFATLWPVAHQAPLIFQVKILEWVAMSSFRGSSQPRDGTCISMSPAFAGRFFIISVTWEALIHSTKLKKKKGKGETFKARQADHSLALPG